MKQQVVIIADSDPRKKIVGGVGTYSAHLAKQLSSTYDVLFIGKKQTGKVKKVPYKVLIANEVVGQSNIAYLRSLHKKRKQFGIKDDAIIHAQRPDWLLPFKKHKGKKIVTLHGSHFKNITTKKGKLWGALYKFLEGKGIACADKVIAVDHETQREYMEWYPAHQQKIVYYPVGVDTSAFTMKKDSFTIRKKLGLPLKKKIFLFVGRLSKEKQVHLMIDAITDEHFVIVGDGELKESLQAQAKGKSILFAGSKNQKELGEYYNAADALLLFSTHEGLPTVVLESLSCGTPILSAPVGEVPHIIKNGETGYVGKNLSQLMKKRLNSSMQEKCRNKAKQYDWKSVAKQIAKEVYS